MDQPLCAINMEVTFLDSYYLTGRPNNESNESMRNRSIPIFGDKSVGGPRAEDFSIESTTIQAGGAWAFETLSFYVPVVDCVAHPVVTSG